MPSHKVPKEMKELSDEERHKLMEGYGALISSLMPSDCHFVLVVAFDDDDGNARITAASTLDTEPTCDLLNLHRQALLDSLAAPPHLTVGPSPN
jgi:hypothetical protein